MWLWDIDPSENNIEDYIEYEIIGKMTDEQLTEVIMNRFKINDISELPRFFKYKDEDELKQCMQEINKIQGINKNQVARVTRLGRSKVEKILNKIEPALNA